jgi:hypothetical protein
VIERSIPPDLVGVSQLGFFTISSYWYVVNVHKIPETHTVLRDRRPSTAACPLLHLLAKGDKLNEIVYGEEKKYFELSRLEQPRQDKNLLYWHDNPKRTNQGRIHFQIHTPFHLIHLSFNSQHGPPFSSLSAQHCHWQRSLF